MEPIVIAFSPNNLGRVDFRAEIMTSDRKSFGRVRFKLDSGSDFTTIACDELYALGYTHEFLKSCPFHHVSASTASEVKELPLQYLSDISIKFGERELQGCRIFFALGTRLRSLFGSDLLKYFNWEVSHDFNVLRLTKTLSAPPLSPEERLLHIYTIENQPTP
ncbi:MAG: hypothetical protein FWG87_09580 [Defluviitaleaceae bacterium]|nr:hypothetical protein [Defluviitaleaceae bacterium]